VQSYGIFTTVRKTMGQDIEGACGQLVVQRRRQQASQSESPPDIEDLGRPAARRRPAKAAPAKAAKVEAVPRPPTRSPLQIVFILLVLFLVYLGLRLGSRYVVL
jgi:hypothetical protein